MASKNLRIADIDFFVLCLALAVNVLSSNRFGSGNSLLNPLTSQDNKIDYINSYVTSSSSTDYSGSFGFTVGDLDLVMPQES